MASPVQSVAPGVPSLRHTQRRAAAHKSLVAALPWRDQLDGVIDVMLDYAALRPIAFPVTDASKKGWRSDGVSATMIDSPPLDERGHLLFLARCEFPLAVCVSSWSVSFGAPLLPGVKPHYFGIGIVASGSTQGNDWVDLTCLGDMHTMSANDTAMHPDSKYCVAPYITVGQARQPGFLIEMPIREAKEAIASKRLATVDLSVDLDAETITWTVYGGQSRSQSVPNLGHMFAYVDLPFGGTARIIQHPNPWLF